MFKDSVRAVQWHGQLPLFEKSQKLGEALRHWKKLSVWHFFSKGKQEDLEVWTGHPHVYLQANSEHERENGGWNTKWEKKFWAIGFPGQVPTV